MRRRTGILLVLTFLAPPATAADWATYRKDVARSGITDDKLALPLTENWVFQTTYPPQPAWGDPKPVAVEEVLELRRVHFDDVFQVVGANGAVYFGSSANGKLYCLDAAAGQIRWTQLTGGPIRLAPTVADGRVYVASDDGCVVCLQARDGAEIWKFRAAPEERRVLGHGKLCSLWPSRTGVLVDQGVAYFGAGIFPAEGVFLYAVNAADGRLLWRNDSTGENPQSRVSPQGYLLASPTALYAPMGRVSPAAFNRADGRLLYETGFGRTSGGTYALLAGGHVYAGTEALVAFDQQTRDQFAVFPGRKIIVTDKTFYVASNSELQALDRQTKAIVWKTPCPLADELILASDVLVVGGANRIMAVATKTGEVRWDAEVTGTAKGLTVVDGRLLVSTDRGRIYCFGPAGTGRHGTVAEPAQPNPLADSPQNALLARAAETILKRTGVQRGYCLMLGCETGKLALELARRSELSIYVVSPDADKVAAVRHAIDQAGLYGARVCVEQWPWDRIPYADYFANLIVSETAVLTGQWPGDPQAALRMLKPQGGTLLIGQPAGAAEGVTPLAEAAARGWLEHPALAGGQLVREDGVWVSLVRGPLPGAGNWTHQYANSANTACGDDQRVKAPLGLLWFGLPGPADMVNRHERAAGPVSLDGRMFVQGENVVMAYDLYNGQQLWHRELPGARRGNASHDGSNFAVGPRGLFVGCGEACLRLDVATGETRATYPMAAAPGGFRRWGTLATVGKFLYGTRAAGAGLSDRLVAIDAETDHEVWHYDAPVISHNTVAVADGLVFLVTSKVTDEQRQAALERQRQLIRELPEAQREQAERALAKPVVRRVVALDASTGAVRWQTPLDLTHCGDNVAAMYQNGALVVFGVYLDGHLWQQFFAGQFATRRVTVLAGKDGQLLWSKPIGYRVRPLIIGDTLHAEPWAFDLPTGTQKTRIHPVTGAEAGWQFARPGHHCGCPSAAPHCLFFRSWNLGYYDLDGDAGTAHFGGQRPGCWINFLPTGGLVVMPEASTGCMCDFPNKCTVVFQPTQQQKAWAWFSAPGPLTPVKELALNLGAPGDRRDSQGRLWLGFPRPAGSLVLNLRGDVAFYPKGQFRQNNSVYTATAETNDAWLFASAAVGLKKCTLPLLDGSSGKARYRVRLAFADPDNREPGQRVFDIRLQGQVVAADFDIVRAAGGGNRATSIEFTGIEVEDKLTLELVTKTPSAPLSALPILHGMDVLRERFVGVGCAPPEFTVNDKHPEQSGEVRLANLRDEPLAGVLRFAPPPGWQITPREVPAPLAAGERQAVSVQIAADAGVAPGRYTIPLRLLRADGAVELERTIRIEHLGARSRATIPVAEDAHVVQRYGTRNFGTAGVLLLDGGDAQLQDKDHAQAFLKFRLVLPGKPVGVRLRLTNAGNPTGDAGRVCLVAEPWDEKKVTYANRPALGRELARLGAVSENEVVERPLDLELTSQQEVSLALDPTSTDGVDYLSRESGSPAVLIIDYEE